VTLYPVKCAQGSWGVCPAEFLPFPSSNLESVLDNVRKRLSQSLSQPACRLSGQLPPPAGRGRHAATRLPCCLPLSSFLLRRPTLLLSFARSPTCPLFFPCLSPGRRVPASTTSRVPSPHPPPSPPSLPLHTTRDGFDCLLARLFPPTLSVTLLSSSPASPIRVVSTCRLVSESVLSVPIEARSPFLFPIRIGGTPRFWPQTRSKRNARPPYSVPELFSCATDPAPFSLLSSPTTFGLPPHVSTEVGRPPGVCLVFLVWPPSAPMFGQSACIASLQDSFARARLVVVVCFGLLRCAPMRVF
jgi:hypothetical protein